MPAIIWRAYFRYCRIDPYYLFLRVYQQLKDFFEKSTLQYRRNGSAGFDGSVSGHESLSLERGDEANKNQLSLSLLLGL